MIKTTDGELTRLKEIPVPQSVEQEIVVGTDSFELPEGFIQAPEAKGGGDIFNDPDRVNWDIDPAGYAEITGHVPSRRD